MCLVCFFEIFVIVIREFGFFGELVFLECLLCVFVYCIMYVYLFFFLFLFNDSECDLL